MGKSLNESLVNVIWVDAPDIAKAKCGKFFLGLGHQILGTHVNCGDSCYRTERSELRSYLRLPYIHIN